MRQTLSLPFFPLPPRRRSSAVITQANEGSDMSELPGHLEFAYRFHFVPRGDFETSRLGYYYSTFCQALQFFVRPEAAPGGAE